MTVLPPAWGPWKFALPELKRGDARASRGGGDTGRGQGMWGYAKSSRRFGGSSLLQAIVTAYPHIPYPDPAFPTPRDAQAGGEGGEKATFTCARLFVGAPVGLH